MPTQARICTHSCIYLRACFLTKCCAFAPSPSRMHPWFQHTHTHTYGHTRTHTGRCVYAHTQASVFTHTHRQVCIHTHTGKRFYTVMHIFVHRTCTQAYIHDLTPTYKHPQTHRYIHRQIHARILLGKQTYYRVTNDQLIAGSIRF